MSAAGAAQSGQRPPAVDVAGIARRFGYRWALRGISLHVEEGESVALLGRNGSGKTTLLRILSTALRPTRGAGRVHDHDLVREADRVRACIGVLGHSPGLYNDLTAAENLDFAMRMAGRGAVAGARDRALEEVGLAGEVDERVRGFSAGMKRRLGLARLMLLEPRLLLLDEPYASFDDDGVERVNAFLDAHRAAGNTIIVATHDPAKAGRRIDRVVRLESGRLIEDSADPNLGERPHASTPQSGRSPAPRVPEAPGRETMTPAGREVRR